MKRVLFTAVFALCTLSVLAQGKSSEIRFELGKGLNVRFNNGQHVVRLGGYLQSDALYESVKDLDPEFGFGIKRAYLSFGGDFYNEKLSFLLQMNYTDAYPLLDAWIAYRPAKWLKLSVGQKQTFTGTRSMMMYDQTLALGNRGLSDRTFYASGREFGIFAESRIPLCTTGFDVGVAVTSGDGRNSFGINSADTDLGGLKYGGRVTFYPLGFFRKDNELTGSDFAHEQKVKIALGGAISYNVGASNQIGEGHGEFHLYDADGGIAYPDYQKIAFDVLMKYRGFTFLAEYTNASGNGIQGLYSSPSPLGGLKPREIADYLTLGDGYNVQAGYLFNGKWAVDLRYSTVRPEWSDHQQKIQNTTAYTAGVARYFIDNRLKVQLIGAYQDWPDATTYNKKVSIQALAHIVF